jgi:uncharacterized ferritin-like protein (DUF455 family)
MKNIFKFAEACLHNTEIEKKLQLTHLAWQLNLNGQLEFTEESKPQPITVTRFPDRPALRDPRQMPRRKFTTRKGISAFFHAIAHIEFIAIYLAWDILYRFRGMPRQFYQDWLQVADEEAQHFVLIREHLLNMGIDYGDLHAHSGLWDVAEDTADNLLARLALVPRFMEARGLDVTPAMIEKFNALGDQDSTLILTRILNDEIGHVKLGSHWFSSVCEKLGLHSETKYQELISGQFKGKQRGQLNRALRKKAGFSDAELDWLEQDNFSKSS